MRSVSNAGRKVLPHSPRIATSSLSLMFFRSQRVSTSQSAEAHTYFLSPQRATTPVLWRQKVGAVCAAERSSERYSLSPVSLTRIRCQERIVLPSPNGAALCLQTGQTPTFTACLRNATAVARAVAQIGRRVAVIAAGERWPSGGLRPGLEDWLGAGAVVAALHGRRSPEAEAACLAFEAACSHVGSVLLECVSGRELVARGFADDVVIASQLNVSDCAPRLLEGAFVAQPRSEGSRIRAV